MLYKRLLFDRITWICYLKMLAYVGDSHMTMLTVTLCVYKIKVYLRNIYCCRRQIHNWHRQISKYNTAISIVMQDFWYLVLNPTFSNISAISWRSVLVVEEAGLPGENHWPWASNCKLYHLRLRVECTLFSSPGL